MSGLRAVTLPLFAAGFFVLFYIEPITVGGVKVALIWKAIFIALALVLVGQKVAKSGVSKFSFWGVVYAVQSGVNLSTPLAPLECIEETVKNSYIPVIFELLKTRRDGGKARKSLHFWVLLIAYSSILSTIPFLLGVLHPLTAGYDLSIFGIEGEGFVGVFQNAHAASITLAFALIVVVHHYMLSRSKVTRALVLGAGLLAGTAIYLTFVRTGYFVAIIGSSTIFLTDPRIRFRKIKLVLVSILVVGAAAILFQESEVFRMRILGLNVYTADSRTLSDGVGSGRERFWLATVDYFSDQDVPVQLVGLGPQVGKELMQDAVGLRISSHNGFLDILQYNGFLGLLLYLTFFTYGIREVWKARSTNLRGLVAALGIAYVAQMLVQGERVFLADVVVAMSLAAARRDRYAASGMEMRAGGRSSL